jgi:hypothetical protein
MMQRRGCSQSFCLWRLSPGNASEILDGHSALVVYNDISANKPWLLDFQSRGDKWQDVKGWLLNAGLISG